jgi:hypothetical protein
VVRGIGVRVSSFVMMDVDVMGWFLLRANNEFSTSCQAILRLLLRFEESCGGKVSLLDFAVHVPSLVTYTTCNQIMQCPDLQQDEPEKNRFQWSCDHVFRCHLLCHSGKEFLPKQTHVCGARCKKRDKRDCDDENSRTRIT